MSRGVRWIREGPPATADEVRRSMVELLREHGNDPTNSGRHENTPLQDARALDRSEAVIQLLTPKNAGQ